MIWGFELDNLFPSCSMYTHSIRAQFEGTGVGTAIKSVAKDLASGKANWSPGLPIMSVVYMSTYLTGE